MSLMEFLIENKSLIAACNTIKGAADKRSTMPVLAHCLITATDTGVTLQATDLFLRMETDITEVEVKKRGAISVPLKELLERLKVMPDGKIRFRVTDSFQCEILSETSKRKFTLSGLNERDFPFLAPCPLRTIDSNVVRIPGQTLKTLLHSTVYAASDDTTRQHINCLCFEKADNLLVMVATDGYRIAMAETDFQHTQAWKVLIRLKGAHELLKFIDPAKDVLFARESTQLFFGIEGGSTWISIRNVDAQFPPFKQIFPESNPEIEVTFDRQAVSDCLKAVQVISNQEHLHVHMHFSKADSLLEFSCKTASGESSDEVQLASYKGRNITIGVNVHYLSETLDAFEASNVFLGIRGELDALELRTSNESLRMLSLVMPARL